MLRSLSRSIHRFFAISKFNEHQPVTPLAAFYPNPTSNTWISNSASVVGEVHLDGRVLVFPGVVIRGDMNRVNIADEVAILHNCSISTTPAIHNSGRLAHMDIDSHCIIGPNCTLISCSLEENVFIGSNSVICEGAIIGKGSMIGPNSVVPPSRVIPAGQVWAGSPVRFIKEVERPDWVTNIYKLKYNKKFAESFRGTDYLVNDAYLSLESELAQEIQEAQLQPADQPQNTKEN